MEEPECQNKDATTSEGSEEEEDWENPSSSPPHVFSDSDRGSDSLAGFYELYQAKQLVDVKLVVDGRVFECHRTLLATCGDYFRTMFTANLAEKSQNEIELHGMEAGVMEVIITYFYTGKISLDLDNVKDIISAADYLQLPKLKKGCNSYICDNNKLNSHNAIGFYFFAKSHHCKEIEEFAKKIITRKMASIVNYGEIRTLSLDCFKEILNLPDLEVSEDDLFYTMREWVEADLEARTPHIPDVFSLLRFSCMDRFMLYDSKIMSEPMLKTNPKMRAILDEVIRYKMITERWVEFDINLEPARSYYTRRAVVYTVDVSGKEGSWCTKIYAYGDLNQGDDKMWSSGDHDLSRISLDELPDNGTQDDLANSVLLTANNGDQFGLYFVGGETNRKEPPSRDVYEWWELSHEPKPYGLMAHGVKSCSAAQVDQSIYVVGGEENGQRLDNVFEFHNGVDQRAFEDPTPRLPWPIRFSCAIGFEGSLYVFGGEKKSPTDKSRTKIRLGVVSNEVYRYISTNQGYEEYRWMTMAPMKHARAWAGCTVLNKKIYVIGGGFIEADENYPITPLQSVEIYDPEDDSWSDGPELPVPLYGMGVVKFRETIYVLGGRFKNATSSSVYYLNHERNAWLQDKDLAQPTSTTNGFSSKSLPHSSFAVVNLNFPTNEASESYVSDNKSPETEPWSDPDEN